METKYQSGSAFFWLLPCMALSLRCHSKNRNQLKQPLNLSALSLLIQCLKSLIRALQGLNLFLSQSKIVSQRRNHHLSLSQSQSQIQDLSQDLSQDQHLITFQNLSLNPFQNLSQSLRKSRPSMPIQHQSLNFLSRKVSLLLSSLALCKRTHYQQGRCKQPLVSLKAPGSSSGSSRNTPCGQDAWDGKDWWG